MILPTPQTAKILALQEKVKQQEKSILAVLKLLTRKDMFLETERCKTYNKDCIACLYWKMFDLLTDALKI